MIFSCVTGVTEEKKKKTIAAGLKTSVLFHRRSILFDNYAAGDSVICV